MKQIPKPQTGEYKPFTAAYINLVNDDLQVEELKTKFEEMRAFILSIPEDNLAYCYSEGKWTIKEMLVHMIDTERIFSYRTLRIARNDKTSLPGFDQDVFVPYSHANERSISSILGEFDAVRGSTYLLFSSFDDVALNRIGSVDNHPVSVRAILYITIGHAQHHINIIKERYL